VRACLLGGDPRTVVTEDEGANWLSNGQPPGAQNASTTEDGSYALNGATTQAQLMGVTRKANAIWAIPTEDEWYKAAYYDPNKPGGAGYWNYPTRSNAVPSNLLDPSGTNNADYYNGGYTIGAPYYRTEVGAFASSPSAYGTFDQGGNLWQWNETAIAGPYRGLRGGSFYNDDSYLTASYRGYSNPTYVDYFFGFRIAEVPEPATMLLALAGAGLLARRRRSRAAV
jgi:sulfatase modifying factor 1